MQSHAEDLRFPPAGADGGLAPPPAPVRCPACGALLDSGDDFLFYPRTNPAARWAHRPPAVGCSRCLRRRPVY